MSKNEYLMACVEERQRHETALSVWRDFIDERRGEIMRKFSEGDYSNLYDDMSELRLLKAYEDNCYARISRGNAAEEIMSRPKEENKKC